MEHIDNINHPPHYTSHPSGLECIDFTERMNFCLGNAWKYLWRAGKKSGVIIGIKDHPAPGDEIATDKKALEDIEKAVWYINREIADRKGLILRGQSVDSHMPATMMGRFNDFMRYESGTRASVFLALFNAVQGVRTTAPLFDALKHIEALKHEVVE